MRLQEPSQSCRAANDPFIAFLAYLELFKWRCREEICSSFTFTSSLEAVSCNKCFPSSFPPPRILFRSLPSSALLPGHFLINLYPFFLRRLSVILPVVTSVSPPLRRSAHLFRALPAPLLVNRFPLTLPSASYLLGSGPFELEFSSLRSIRVRSPAHLSIFPSSFHL